LLPAQGITEGVAEFIDRQGERAATAGQAGENDRAADHLAEAAQQAGRGWAKPRALSLYGQAIELLPEDDPRRRSIRMQQAVLAQAVFHMQHEDVGRGPADDGSSA